MIPDTKLIHYGDFLLLTRNVRTVVSQHVCHIDSASVTDDRKRHVLDVKAKKEVDGNAATLVLIVRFFINR